MVHVQAPAMGWVGLWLSTFGVIFAIVDPFGYVPIFLAMTANDSEERRKQMVRRACLASFALLAFFTFFGSPLLRFFGISIPALQISGGLILLLIGFEMSKVLPIGEKLTPVEEREGRDKDDISIIPLAIPMLSGPASIASVIVLGTKTPTWMGYSAILVSIAATLAFTYLILRSATRILRLVGITGLKVVTRIMGFLLCAMAIQFVINGWVAIR